MHAAVVGPGTLVTRVSGRSFGDAFADRLQRRAYRGGGFLKGEVVIKD